MATFNDRIKLAKFPIQLENWNTVKDTIFQLADNCVKPEQLDFYRETTRLFTWVEQLEIERLDQSERNRTEVDLKKAGNIITVLRNSLKRDEELVIPREIAATGTLDEMITQILALKHRLSNPRSIKCAFEIGEILCRL